VEILFLYAQVPIHHLHWVVAILNKHTTSSHQRPIHPITSRQILSKTHVMVLFQIYSHASCIRISRHIHRRINKENKEVRRNLLQDIRKFQTPLILLKGFLVEVHLLSAECMREKGEPLSKHWGVWECVTGTETKRKVD